MIIIGCDFHSRFQQIAPATVNRQLATLRRLLRLAHEWQVINRAPRIRMLPGERNREFGLAHKQENLYLEMAPQPLRDVALLILDTGLQNRRGPGTRMDQRTSGASAGRKVRLSPCTGWEVKERAPQSQPHGAGTRQVGSPRPSGGIPLRASC